MVLTQCDTVLCEAASGGGSSCEDGDGVEEAAENDACTQTGELELEQQQREQQKQKQAGRS